MERLYGKRGPKNHDYRKDSSKERRKVRATEVHFDVGLEVLRSARFFTRGIDKSNNSRHFNG